MAKTKIEWCDFTFNPWYGCTKVSPGCDNCYAETMMDKRYGKVEWGPHGERKRTSETYWRQPLKWAKAACAEQERWETKSIFNRSLERPPRPRVFCASLADVFDNQVPSDWRADLFQLIHDTPELDWLILTKRPENIAKMDCWPTLPWQNLWLGFSAENQEYFDRRWPIVREIPAVVRFCSYEPALGSLRLTSGDHGKLDWLIFGGESGPGYRGFDGRWEHEIRNDCLAIGISYFFKQMAGKAPIPAAFPLVRQFPEPRRETRE